MYIYIKLTFSLSYVNCPSTPYLLCIPFYLKKQSLKSILKYFKYFKKKKWANLYSHQFGGWQLKRMVIMHFQMRFPFSFLEGNPTKDEADLRDVSLKQGHQRDPPQWPEFAVQRVPLRSISVPMQTPKQAARPATPWTDKLWWETAQATGCDMPSDKIFKWLWLYIFTVQMPPPDLNCL